MKTVKTFAAILFMTGFLSTAAFAQDSKMDKKMDKMESKMEKKTDKMDSKMDHKMDKMDDKMAMKDHKCTKACKDGKHVYAHGEKGHVCGDACKKMEKNSKM